MNPFSKIILKASILIALAIFIRVAIIPDVSVFIVLFFASGFILYFYFINIVILKN